MIETKGNRAQRSRADIPIKAVTEENLWLVVGLPERSRIFGVVYLPVGLLGITEPEGCAIIKNAGQQRYLETDLVFRFLLLQTVVITTGAQSRADRPWIRVVYVSNRQDIVGPMGNKAAGE